MIPPKKLKLNIPWVVILNGYYILPLQTGWAILLKEFIEAVNKETEKFKSVENTMFLKFRNFPKTRMYLFLLC